HIVEIDGRRVGKVQHPFGAPYNSPATLVEIWIVPTNHMVVETEPACEHLAKSNVTGFRQAESERRQRAVMLANCGCSGPAVVATAQENTDPFRASHPPLNCAIE